MIPGQNEDVSKRQDENHSSRAAKHLPILYLHDEDGSQRAALRVLLGDG